MRKHLPEWRAAGRFRGGIHEPALLTLRLEEIEQAVYVEKEAGAQQLEAFVCEEATEATLAGALAPAAGNAGAEGVPAPGGGGTFRALCAGSVFPHPLNVREASTHETAEKMKNDDG